MKLTHYLLTLSLISLGNLALADDPEASRIENQLSELDLLIRAVGAADAIPVSETEPGELERQTYRLRDALGELVVRSFRDVTDLLHETDEAEWSQALSKSEWTHRLIKHFFNHHLDSGNEEWVSILAQLSIDNQAAVLTLFQSLSDDERDRILKT